MSVQLLAKKCMKNLTVEVTQSQIKILHSFMLYRRENTPNVKTKSETILCLYNSFSGRFNLKNNDIEFIGTQRQKSSVLDTTKSSEYRRGACSRFDHFRDTTFSKYYFV